MIIVVRGTPAPQGSKRHVGGGRMIEQSRAVGPWREAVRAQCQLRMEKNGHLPYTGPVKATIQFYLPRPKSTPKRIIFPARRPDLDKLARSVLDGLTMGGAWKDDAQVIELTCCKIFADENNSPGCTIVLEEL